MKPEDLASWMRGSVGAAVLPLLVALGCSSSSSGGNDDAPAGGSDSGGVDGSGSGTDTAPPEACPGVSDPECTTSNACGNDEICVMCECVPTPNECEGTADSNCITDADCGEREECVSCVCESLCIGDENECSEDLDCPRGETCEAVEDADVCLCSGSIGCAPEAACQVDEDCQSGETCVACECQAACECSDEMPCDAPLTCDGCNCIAEGEEDPDSDCEDDFGPVRCDPQIDITNLYFDCLDDGSFTAAIEYADAPLVEVPDDLVQREISLDNADGISILGVFATAGPNPYQCQLNDPGIMLFELGEEDECGLSEDSNRFEVRLSPATLAYPEDTITSVRVFSSTLEGGFQQDEAGPFDFPCL